MFRIDRRKFIWIVASVLVIVLGLTGFIFFQSRSANLEVIFLDIGQGDAILIKTPGKQNILIDGGPDKSVLYQLDKYLWPGDRRIDLVVLTHPDNDHLTGLVEVFRRYEVERVLTTGVVNPTSSYLACQEELEKEKSLKIIARADQKIDFGRGVKMKVLWPEKNLETETVEDTNFVSIVIMLEFDDTSFLLTGDAPIEVEELLIDKGADLKADVLKVGHHGSKSSTSKEFLEAIRPEFAVISVGQDNKFGHPAYRVLKNLENVKTLRTDQQGDILFISDGDNLWLKTGK